MKHNFFGPTKEKVTKFNRRSWKMNIPKIQFKLALQHKKEIAPINRLG